MFGRGCQTSGMQAIKRSTVNGQPVQEMPRVSRMAAEGVVLTDAYSASPLCSPSRASTLTGRLPIRNGFYSSTWFGRNAYAGQGVAAQPERRAA